MSYSADDLYVTVNGVEVKTETAEVPMSNIGKKLAVLHTSTGDVELEVTREEFNKLIDEFWKLNSDETSNI